MSEQLVTTFYRAFQNLDEPTMVSCYGPDAHFRDPVFDLHGSDIADMWTMLCTNAREFSLEFDAVTADSAHWVASYKFSTGRQVVNDINASFTFTADDLIATHEDRFDLWKWSRQALGPIGAGLGWSPILRARIRQQAAAGLRAYQSRNK